MGKILNKGRHQTGKQRFDIKCLSRMLGLLVILAAVLLLGYGDGNQQAGPLVLPVAMAEKKTDPEEKPTAPREPETLPPIAAATDASTAADTSLEDGQPLPKTTPVQDAYFDDAAFIGDSRTEGFRL